jgi:hypothetical protein
MIDRWSTWVVSSTISAPMTKFSEKPKANEVTGRVGKNARDMYLYCQSSYTSYTSVCTRRNTERGRTTRCMNHSRSRRKIVQDRARTTRPRVIRIRVGGSRSKIRNISVSDAHSYAFRVFLLSGRPPLWTCVYGVM